MKPVERKALTFNVKPASVKQEVSFEPVLIGLSRYDGTAMPFTRT